MPSTSINTSVGSGITSFNLVIPISKGRLTGVAIHQLSGTVIPGTLHVSCSLSKEVSTLAQSIVHFFAGSFASNEPLGWTGDIPLDQDYFINARIQTEQTAAIKLSCITEV